MPTNYGQKQGKHANSKHTSRPDRTLINNRRGFALPENSRTRRMCHKIDREMAKTLVARVEKRQSIKKRKRERESKTASRVGRDEAFNLKENYPIVRTAVLLDRECT